MYVWTGLHLEMTDWKWSLEDDTDASFVFVNETKTWKDAQIYCRERYTDLASVRSYRENHHIMMLADGRSFWIGLYRGQWKWSDGTPVSFQKQNLQPNSNHASCGQLNHHKWRVVKCKTPTFFVSNNKPYEHTPSQLIHQR
uniref:C-type lectin domain-containing protein n=1 Tax=Stegastes partitus TaxID=144197 RepID=A0A3B5ARZ7_9TELE